MAIDDQRPAAMGPLDGGSIDSGPRFRLLVDRSPVRAADARFSDLLSGIDLGALILDTSGRVEFINDFLLGLLDRNRDEILGQDWIDIAVPQGEGAALRETFAAAIASGAGAGQREDGIVTRSGEERRLL